MEITPIEQEKESNPIGKGEFGDVILGNHNNGASSHWPVTWKSHIASTDEFMQGHQR